MQAQGLVDLVLASSSPRRRELLERIGLALRVEPAHLDETPRAGERPREHAIRVAAAKCDAVASRLSAAIETLPVLAADTTVALGGEIFGKPSDDAAAADMLRRLAGRRHDVITAYRVRRGDVVIERAVTTSVTVRLLDAAEIGAYVASGEWRDKAGGYALQGIAALFVTDVRGSVTNVIGLPLAEVVADLRAAGALARYPPPAFGGRPE